MSDIKLGMKVEILGSATGGPFVLAAVRPNELLFVCTVSGRRWNHPRMVADTLSPTEGELRSLLGSAFSTAVLIRDDGSRVHLPEAS